MMPGRKGQPAGGAGFAIQQPLRPGFELVAIPFAVRRQLFVTDDPVGPEVGHLDDQMVRARFRGGGDVHAERRLP